MKENLEIGKFYVVNGDVMEYDGITFGAYGFRGHLDGVMLFGEPNVEREATEAEVNELLAARRLADNDKAAFVAQWGAE